MPPSRAKAPELPLRTFDEAFAELRLTADERAALVWHLAQMRARKTIEALLPNADYAPGINEEMMDVLRTHGADRRP